MSNFHKNADDRTASVVQWSEFLATHTVAEKLIPVVAHLVSIQEPPTSCNVI
jgi:hypothetical protein